MDELVGKSNAFDVIKTFGLEVGVEHSMLECKEAGFKLPDSFWETYSSFANTDGGIVLLGVKEIVEDRRFIVTGVSRPLDIVKNLWDSLSNKNKVNRNLLNNDDVEIVTDVSGEKVIIVHVPQAAIKQRPVFINNNQMNTFLRKGESDIRADEDELNIMIRNSSISCHDAEILSGYTLDDLDKVAISEFRGKVSAKYPEKNYEEMSFEEFLIQTGFYGRENHSSAYYPRIGCLLLFGKYNEIKEIVPNYFLDYLDYRNSSDRWRDRLSTDLPSDQEMNIFNFYNKVYNKLMAVDESRFKLDSNLERVDSSLSEALREALINTIVHADYFISRGYVKISVYDDRYVFSNSGCMLIDKADFFMGGKSEIRNEILMKCFRFQGLAEREGMGGSEIAKVAIENKLRLPSLDTNLLNTELVIWKTDLAEYPELSEYEKAVFKFIIEAARPVSVKEIREKLHYSKYRVTLSLNTLIKQGKVEKTGVSVSTKYMLNPFSLEMATNIQKAARIFADVAKNWPKI